MNITINSEKQLYVLKTSVGTSCHGFANVKRDAQSMLSRMNDNTVLPADGSLALYAAYQALLQRFALHPASRQTWYNTETDPKLVHALNAAYRNSRLVRIFLGNRETGLDWCEENNVTGFIGRSSGTFKVPLLLEAYRTGSASFESAGYGDPINTTAVLRIVEVLSQKELYRHPKYRAPSFKVKGASEDLRKLGYFFSVVRTDQGSGETVANCKTEGEAYGYVSFMLGNSLGTPFRTRAQADAGIEI